MARACRRVGREGGRGSRCIKTSGKWYAEVQELKSDFPGSFEPSAQIARCIIAQMSFRTCTFRGSTAKINDQRRRRGYVWNCRRLAITEQLRRETKETRRPPSSVRTCTGTLIYLLRSPIESRQF